MNERELREIQTETYAELKIIDELIEMRYEIDKLKRDVENLQKQINNKGDE